MATPRQGSANKTSLRKTSLGHPHCCADRSRNLGYLSHNGGDNGETGKIEVGGRLKAAAAWPRCGMAGDAGGGAARPRAESARGHALSGPLHRARIHQHVPGDRPARLRPHRDRLRAAAMAARVEVAEALSRELPQPRRVPRGLHGFDRPAHRRRDQAEVAAHRRLLVSARRHPDRRVLADRARRRRISGFPTRACRPIVAVADRIKAARR